MEGLVSKQQSSDVVALLRLSGLLKGGARVARGAVLIPLAVGPRVSSGDVVEALEAAHPETKQQVLKMIRRTTARSIEGTLTVTLNMGTAMAAIHCQTSANTGASINPGS